MLSFHDNSNSDLGPMKFPPFQRPDPSDGFDKWIDSHLPEAAYFVRWLIDIFLLYLGFQVGELIAEFLGPPWSPW